MDHPSYRYEPLNTPDEIRVAKFSTNTTRIELCIFHISVESHAYQALSYVWGSLEQVNEATIVDEKGEVLGFIPLTMKLSNALYDLRNTQELQGECFWIDQISINQQDEDEKNRQVAIMSSIYAQARQVITYLGPVTSEEEEKRGIGLLDKIHDQIPDQLWGQIFEAASLRRVRESILDGSIQLQLLPLDLDPGNEQVLKDDEIHRRYVEQGWKWLIETAYGDWTRRLWIVQEQVLNKQITALRGRRLLDWDKIATIPALFGVLHLPFPYLSVYAQSFGEKIENVLTIGRTMYGTWWERRARQSETGYDWSPLLENLQWYQSLLCRDARDRVYALLAMSSDSAALRIQPDYSAGNSPDVLSIELSTRILLSGNTLRLLIWSLSWRRPDSILPSWCLNLDMHVAHCDQPARFRMDNTILVVKGRIMDHISIQSTISVVAQEASIEVQDVYFLCSLVQALTDDFSIETVARLLWAVTARSPWSPPATARTSKYNATAFHFWTYIRCWMRELTHNGRVVPSAHNHVFESCQRILEKVELLAPCNVYPRTPLNVDRSPEEESTLKSVLLHGLERGRCIGRTATGRFFNAWPDVRDGDSIAAFQGSDELFVIRSTGSAYTLVCDVCVEGLMDGQAYEGLDPREVDYDIELV